jgi:hypothetical protein
MNATKGEDRSFLGQRRAGMIAIAAAMPVALLLWPLKGNHHCMDASRKIQRGYG